MKTMSYPGFKLFGCRLERFFNGSQDRVALTRRKIGHLMQKVTLWRYAETPRWVTSGFCELSDLTQSVDRMIETLTAITASQLRLLRRTGAVLDGLSIDSQLIDARRLEFANGAWLTFGGGFLSTNSTCYDFNGRSFAEIQDFLFTDAAFHDVIGQAACAAVLETIHGMAYAVSPIDTPNLAVHAGGVSPFTDAAATGTYKENTLSAFDAIAVADALLERNDEDLQ